MHGDLPSRNGEVGDLLPADVDTRLLDAGTDLDALARLALDVMGREPGSGAYLAIGDRDSRTLRVHAWAFADDPDPGPPPPDRIAFDTSMGRAYVAQIVVHVQRPPGVTRQRAESGFRAALSTHPAGQFICAPVMAGNESIGVLTITYPPGRTSVDAIAKARLAAISHRMALLIDHARLADGLTRGRRRHDGLADLNERAAGCGTSEELFQLVTAITAHTLDADASVLLQVDPDDGAAVLAAAVGVPDGMVGTVRLQTTGAIFRRLVAGEPFVHIVSSDDPDDMTPGQRAFGAVASLAVAVRHQHRLMAVLAVGRRTRDAFTKGDEEFMVTVAATVGAVLDSRAAHDRLRRQSLSDELTGLPNRNLMSVRVQEAIARAASGGSTVALLLADLDGFKVLNDSLGHLAGDHILRVVAARLSGLIRPEDTLARLGGDEFALLCHGADERTAVAIAERVLTALTEPVRVEGTEVVPRASIGITVYDPSAPELHGDAGDLLPQADLAMYRAKASPRHRIAVYDVAMHEAVQQRLLLEQGLRAAIGTDQLSLHYQPIVRLSDGAVRSLEALTRWTHPTLGPVRPDQFIAVAEESDLICALSTWVLREVCQQVVRWRADGLLTGSACVALNMSARDLTDPGMVERFQRVLSETGCDPTWLYVEVTESLFTDAAGAEAVRELKQLGLHIALDDYGTGFSSLGQLKRVPVDVLKIDRSFVNNLLTDPVDATIVTSTIALAHALGKRVVAEGIETTDQLHRLLELGCDSGQGYLFARPQPVDVISRYLAEGVPDLAARLGL